MIEMRKGVVARAAAMGLLLVGLGASGCTAKYEQFLQERDHEIAALKEDKSKLQAEARMLRSAEGKMVGRVNELKRENAELQRALTDARSQVSIAPAAMSGPGTAELRSMASRNGLEVRDRPEGVALVLPNTVTFRSGSAQLSAKGKRVLAEVAKTIRRNFSGRTLSIEGHTDSQPIRRSKFGTNWRLSAERAESVRGYLRKVGIGASGNKRIRVVGYGPTVPLGSNDKESGRRKNRRVEVVILNT